MFADSQHSKRRRALDGIAVDTGADGREGDGLEASLGGQLQRAPVARREQVRLPVLPAAPNRSHGMNDLPGRKAVAAGDSRVARRTPAQGPAFGEQFRSRCLVYRTIHAAAAAIITKIGMSKGLITARNDSQFSPKRKPP